MGELTGKTEKRYDSIDGLRVFAALGIIAMHVLTNGKYSLGGFVFRELFSSFADLVFLFMMVSGFSLCCGYYERISKGQMTPTAFYSKRYAKILPFFAVLTVLDFAFSPSVDTLMEAFANITLCFGLLPNASISVIGVGWTLGVIFVFYLLFPFFCYLLSSKKKGWFVLAVAVIWNVVCRMYFLDDAHVIAEFSNRTNILYVAIYFIAGGLIYLYRDEIQRIFGQSLLKWVFILIALVCGVGYFLFSKNTIVIVLFYGCLIMFAVSRGTGKGLLNNRCTKFISGISMEMYLSHMVVFRMTEKMGMLRLFRSEALSFCTAFVITLTGTVLFSMIVGRGIKELSKALQKLKMRHCA